jgi:hypothetical protein
MYYRVMVGFEGGEYVFGPANRAIAPIKTLEPKYDYEEPFSFKEKDKRNLDGGNF